MIVSKVLKFFLKSTSYTKYIVLAGYSKYFPDEDLIPGWKWLGRKADTADFEWKMWTPIFFSWLQYVTPYLIISLVLKRKYPQSVPLVCIAISFLWLCNMIGLSLTVFLFIQPVLFYWILQLFSLEVVWLTCIGCTLSLHAYNLTERIVSILRLPVVNNQFYTHLNFLWNYREIYLM